MRYALIEFNRLLRSFDVVNFWFISHAECEWGMRNKKRLDRAQPKWPSNRTVERYVAIHQNSIEQNQTDACTRLWNLLHILLGHRLRTAQLCQRHPLHPRACSTPSLSHHRRNRRVNKFPHRITGAVKPVWSSMYQLPAALVPHDLTLSQSKRDDFIQTFFVPMLWFLYGSRTGHRRAWILDILNWTCGKTSQLPERQNKNKDKLVSFAGRRNEYHLQTITYIFVCILKRNVQ